MVLLKEKIKYYFFGLKYLKRCFKVLKKGQSIDHQILQLSHRIEKGLTNTRPKNNWGEQKAKQLLDLIQLCDDSYIKEIGTSVLTSYCQAKIESTDKSEVEFATKLIYEIREKGLNANSKCGGIRVIQKSDVIKDFFSFEEFVSSRHSIRDFSDDEVTENEILKAARIALNSPSACNRQPYNLFVLFKKNISKNDKIDNSYNAYALVYVTATIDAYSLDETPDWIVSGSIFATYFVLALHSIGIGSCLIRKDLLRDEYNSIVRKKCKIPNNEQIILEIAVGKYKDAFAVTKSARKKEENVVHIVE